MNYALIQSVKYDDKSIPPEWVHSAAYIENLDLSGPKLIIVFTDKSGILFDKAGIKEHEGVLSLIIADPLVRDETFLEETFTIEKLESIGGGALKLQCMAEAVSAVKRPSTGCVIYPPAAPSDAVNAITKAKTLDASALPAGEAYHLLDGMRPSRLLRKIAAENGARIFYCRGTWYFKTLDDLFSAEISDSYFHNKPLRGKAMTDVVAYGHSAVASEIAQRRLMGWDMVNGMIESGTGRPLMTGFKDEAVLKAANRTLLPELEFQNRAIPDPKLKPSDRLTLEWHRPTNEEAPIDESMPTSVLVDTVAHYVKGNRFSQRVVTAKDSVASE